VAGLTKSAALECTLSEERALLLDWYNTSALLSEADPESVANRVKNFAMEADIADSRRWSREPPGRDPAGREVRKVWARAVSNILTTRLPSAQEQSRLERFAQTYGFWDVDEPDVTAARVLLSKAATLRALTEGTIVESIWPLQLPFNFLKGEQLVWVFLEVIYYQQRIRRSRIGSYDGFSMKIMKGLYYHTGGFESRTVEKESLVAVDHGTLAVTNENLYFAGASKDFRLPLDKIVTFRPFKDAVEIERDVKDAHPEIFLTGDGWFSFNLMMNLASLRRS
jgi:hypothetical protein